MQLTLFGRQVDVMLRSRLESVDTAEHDLATLYEKKKVINEVIGNQGEPSFPIPTTAKVPLTFEQEHVSMGQQDESTVHQNKNGVIEAIQKAHKPFHDHERNAMENQKQHCNVLRHGFQRIEKKMDSVTGALSKVHKSILTLSQGMLTLARQTAAMNAELVKTNHQIASTFQRLIQLKELELSKTTPSHFSDPTQSSNSNRSIMPRKSRAKGGRRLSI